MLVFKSETSLRDHILNVAAGKRVRAEGAELPAPHAPYPVIEHRGVRTQFLSTSFTLYTGIPDSIAFLETLLHLEPGQNLNGCIPLAAIGMEMVSQHQIAPAAQNTISVAALQLCMHKSFVNCIYDPDDLVMAEDGERLTRDQCENPHRVFRCSQDILPASGLLQGVVTADTPIYCRTRGWSLQIARETAPYNAVYDTVYIPATINKIIMTKDRIDAAPTCIKCTGRACGTAYRIAFGSDFVCAACAHTISMFESLRGVLCPEVRLQSPRDLLMLPARLEAAGAMEVLITSTDAATYIGVASLEGYYDATAYEGLPYPNPVIYRVNII